MKVAVIGAGAIGSLVAGYLENKGEEVVLAGRPATVLAIQHEGLRISGVRGAMIVPLHVADRITQPVDLAILAVKTQDLMQAMKMHAASLGNAAVLTTQNGVQADAIVARFIPHERIISSIVMFGATYAGDAKVVHNFEGSWVIGRLDGAKDDTLIAVRDLLQKAFPVIATDSIRGMKYLKIFLNANNCIPALLGVSMQDAFSDTALSKISIAIWREGLKVITKAGVGLVSLPEFPLERLTGLADLPIDGAARVFSGIMTGLSKEPLYGSILQSIQRGRASEIDYINGELVTLARQHGMAAPLNEKLVTMVHEVESRRAFFTRDEVVKQVEGLSV